MYQACRSLSSAHLMPYPSTVFHQEQNYFLYTKQNYSQCLERWPHKILKTIRQLYSALLTLFTESHTLQSVSDACVVRSWQENLLRSADHVQPLHSCPVSCGCICTNSHVKSSFTAHAILSQSVDLIYSYNSNQICMSSIFDNQIKVIIGLAKKFVRVFRTILLKI